MLLIFNHSYCCPPLRLNGYRGQFELMFKLTQTIDKLFCPGWGVLSKFSFIFKHSTAEPQRLLIIPKLKQLEHTDSSYGALQQVESLGRFKTGPDMSIQLQKALCHAP
jgi:hypothetical protein